MSSNNISIKLDLQKLAGATVMPVGKDNVECLVIPIGIANLFKGTKGIYLDITAIALTAPKADSKDTHLLKQSLSKEKLSAMSEEEKRAMPILGNAIDWDKTASAGSSTPAAGAPAGGTPTWL